MADQVVAELSPEGDRIGIVSEFWRKEQVKMVPGASFLDELKIWTVPATWQSCQALRGIFGQDLVLGERLMSWAWSLKTERIDPLMELRDPTNFHTAGDERLYPYQRAGTAWLKAARTGLLADEMGTGKTVQAAMALEELGPECFPVLIVCPNSMKYTWRSELEKWAPATKKAVILEGGPKGRQAALDSVKGGDANVAIVNYETTWRMSRQAGYDSMTLTAGEKKDGPLNKVAWKTVILDEGHKIKNPRAQQTRACWALGRMDTVRYRFILTGTPIANRPNDLWALLNFLDSKQFPGMTKFIDRYCLMSYNGFGAIDISGMNPDHLEEFHRVVDPLMRRVTKDMVLKQLPPIMRTRRDCTMGTKQKAAYKAMLDAMIVELETAEAEGSFISATTAIAQLTRLVQFASSYAELVDDKVRLTEPSCKIDALEDLMEDELEGEPIVVFAMSKQLIDLATARLEKKGIECRRITGGQTPADRQKNVDDFQNGRAQVILCTVGAGGVGITLTRAKVAVFLQRSWSMVDNIQAEARVHRIGSEQHASVTIIDLVSTGTVDERMQDVILMKKERLEEIVRDREQLSRFLQLRPMED